MSPRGRSLRDQIAGTADAPAAPAFRTPTPTNNYPRRVTLDLDDARYDWVKEAAGDAHMPLSAFLRAVLDHVRDDPKALDAISPRRRR